MAVWEKPETLRDLTAAALDYAPIRQAAGKIVYSKTLQSVSGPVTRIERRSEADVVRELKATVTRDVAIGEAQRGEHDEQPTGST